MAILTLRDAVNLICSSPYGRMATNTRTHTLSLVFASQLKRKKENNIILSI